MGSEALRGRRRSSPCRCCPAGLPCRPIPARRWRCCLGRALGRRPAGPAPDSATVLVVEDLMPEDRADPSASIPDIVMLTMTGRTRADGGSAQQPVRRCRFRACQSHRHAIVVRHTDRSHSARLAGQGPVRRAGRWRPVRPCRARDRCCVIPDRTVSLRPPDPAWCPAQGPRSGSGARRRAVGTGPRSRVGRSR
jgi:hypothetical protein